MIAIRRILCLSTGTKHFLYCRCLQVFMGMIAIWWSLGLTAGTKYFLYCRRLKVFMGVIAIRRVFCLTACTKLFFLSHFSTGSTLSFVLGGNPMITQQGSMQSTLHSYWENGWAHSKTNGRNVDLNCKEMGRRKPPCRMFKVLNIVGQSQFVCLLTWYWIARIILEPPF